LFSFLPTPGFLFQTVMVNDALRLISSREPFRENNLSIPAAAGLFSLDASFGLLATASASALALFLGPALCCCGVSCLICEISKKKLKTHTHKNTHHHHLYNCMLGRGVAVSAFVLGQVVVALNHHGEFGFIRTGVFLMDTGGAEQ